MSLGVGLQRAVSSFLGNGDGVARMLMSIDGRRGVGIVVQVICNGRPDGVDFKVSRDQGLWNSQDPSNPKMVASAVLFAQGTG